MSQVATAPPLATGVDEARIVRRLLVLSGVFLVAATLMTDPGSQQDGRGGGPLLGLFLLWRVHRRGRVSRAVLVIFGWYGVVVFAVVSLADVWFLLPAAACLGHVLPLMSAPVRRHVGSLDARDRPIDRPIDRPGRAVRA